MDEEDMWRAMKRTVAALREADVPFAAAGGLASFARGGPRVGHDLDFVVRPADAERALQTLADAGMRVERPPEGWLYKAYDGDVMIDLIFHPSGMAVTDEVFERAETHEVRAVPVPLMAIEDVLCTKLAALREHELGFSELLEMARALREQIDWQRLRRIVPDTPFAAAFFTMVERLGIAPDVQEGPIMSDPDEQTEQQQEEARETRGTGGDAPAAGSIAEREDVAAGRDELFEAGEEPLEGEEPVDTAPDAPDAEREPPG